MSTGNLNDGLIALKDGKMIVLRVPYPLGFYAKGFDGRIDDAGRRLEGPRLVDDQRRPHAVAHGGRQGKPAARRALPAAARSAGTLRGSKGDLIVPVRPPSVHRRKHNHARLASKSRATET